MTTNNDSNHLVSVDGAGVATVTLNRPELRNAFDDRLIATNLNASTRLTGRTDTVMGYGIGGSASFPVLPSLLDVQLSGLYGQGTGRYGSSQLPDFALKANGTIAPIPPAPPRLPSLGSESKMSNSLANRVPGV